MSTARFFALVVKDAEKEIYIIPDLHQAIIPDESEQEKIKQEIKDFYAALSPVLPFEFGFKSKHPFSKSPLQIIRQYVYGSRSPQQVYIERHMQAYIDAHPSIRLFPTDDIFWNVKHKREWHRWEIYDLVLRKQNNIPKHIGRAAFAVWAMGVFTSAFYGFFANLDTKVNLWVALPQIFVGSRVAYITFYATDMREKIENFFSSCLTSIPERNNQLMDEFFNEVEYRHFSLSTRLYGILDLACIAFAIYVGFSSSDENYVNNIDHSYINYFLLWLPFLKEYLTAENFLVGAQVAFVITYFFTSALMPSTFSYSKQVKETKSKISIEEVKTDPWEIQIETQRVIRTAERIQAANEESKLIQNTESQSNLSQAGGPELHLTITDLPSAQSNALTDSKSGLRTIEANNFADSLAGLQQFSLLSARGGSSDLTRPLLDTNARSEQDWAGEVRITVATSPKKVH